jgi:parallel beta-helix repeat protein
VGLEVRANTVTGARTGITFQVQRGLDRFTTPSTRTVVAHNAVTGATRTGVAVAMLQSGVASVVDSVFEANTSTGNGFHGFLLGSGSGNTFRANIADGNGGKGIYASLNTTDNAFTHNSMHGNGWSSEVFLPVMTAPKVDARDDSWPHNTWSNNDCDTDFPTETICGID